MRAVMEAITDPSIRLVSIIAAIQAAKTLSSELCTAFIVANMPGPMLWLNETDDDAKDQAESRLGKLFDECEPVKALYPADRHKKRSTTIHFSNGMVLWCLGAHNRANLQRRSIRWLIGDETWQWPQGHMAEAEARVTAFGWLGKCIFSSQGGVEDDDTHRKFEETDQREWTFACPECGHRQPFIWENVEWSKDCKDETGNYDFVKVRATTAMRCAACNHYIEDSDENRRKLNATGVFVPQNFRCAKENVGFHWNSLATMSWGKLAELYLRAKEAARRGDLSLLQQFTQKRLALAWKEFSDDYKIEIRASGYRMGELWTEEGGFNRLGKVVAPPFDGMTIVPLRILTVDVQQDHFYALVRSWSADGSSRLLWCERILTYTDIEEMQKRNGIHSSLVFLDAGHATYDVYRECAIRGWIALMGDKRGTFQHQGKDGKVIQRFYSPKRRVSLGAGKTCVMHYWSNLSIKDILARLRRNKEAPTWEVPDDAPEDYIAQLESEIRVREKGKTFWKQIGNRPNHYLDCEAMQVAAATMIKLIGREAAESSEIEEETEEAAQ